MIRNDSVPARPKKKTAQKKQPYISHPLLAIRTALGNIFRRNFSTILKVTLISAGAYVLLSLVLIAVSGAALYPIIGELFTNNVSGTLTEAQLNALSAAFAGIIPLFILLAVLVFMPLAIALDSSIIHSHANKLTNVRGAWKRGYRRLPVAVATYLLAGAMVFGGLIFFVLPGLYFALRFIYINALVANEDLGPIDILKRSWDLTRGNLWDIIGIISVGTAVTSLLSLLQHAATVMTGTAHYDHPLYVGLAIIIFIVNLLIGLITQITMLLSYYQSSRQKEGKLIKTATHPLNYGLGVTALALIVGDSMTQPDLFEPTE